MGFPLSSRHGFGMVKNTLGRSRRDSEAVNRRHRRVRLVMEALEDRLVLSSFTVTDNSDSLTDTGSLRYAITTLENNTDSSNTITIESTLTGGQTIALDSALPQITKNVSIAGPGSAAVSISGNGRFQLFNIAAGSTVTISGLTITKGSAVYGGGINNSGTLTIASSVISDNVASLYQNFYEGGTGYGPVSGTGFGEGGGIYNTGVLTITDSSVSSNFADAANPGSGSVFVYGYLPVSYSFSGSAYGGGIYSTSQARVTITGSTISGNSATASGSGSVFGMGISTSQGGGILSYGALTITGSTISGNSTVASSSANYGGSGFSSVAGGGIASASTLTISSSTISGNSAVASAYAPVVNYPDVSSSAYSSAEGGGIACSSPSGESITGSTISGNSADASASAYGLGSSDAYGEGGGISTSSAMTITDSTITGNSASADGSGNSDSHGYGYGYGYGGGILASGALTLANSTITGNTASASGLNSANGDYAYGGSAYGGGISTFDPSQTATPNTGHLTTGNSILADNTAPHGPDVFSTIAVNSQSHNLVGQADGSNGWVSSDLIGTSSSPLDPRLGPLADNGGPTQTIALLPGSPAIDTGANPLAVDPHSDTLAYDQRGAGFSRIVNGTVDIGAFEVQAVPTTTTLTSSASSQRYGGLVTFTATVNAGSSPETAGTVSFLDGRTVLASAIPLNTFGQANFSISSLKCTGDPDNITAVYDGTPTALASSGSVNQFILPAPLWVTVEVPSKVYDGSSSATIAMDSLSGVVPGDRVSLTGGTASFADKNVGANKEVTVTGLTLTGPDAGNYTINASAYTFASITPLAITANVTVMDKVYDGTTAATILADSLSGVRGNDVVSLMGGTASFDTKDAGTCKTVTVTGLSLTGPDAGNYTITGTDRTLAKITPAVLTVIANGVNKVYDGTTAATVTLTDHRVPGDVFTVSDTTAAFTDANAGAGKTIEVDGIAITGRDAVNYTFNPSTTTTADILKANQMIAWFNPDDIGYGTPLSVIQLDATVSGVPGGSAPGMLTYTPSVGTVLRAGMNQKLTVNADATANYNPASLTVEINVLTAAQQAAVLTQDVAALAKIGVLTAGQENALTVKLALKGNQGDTGKVNAFLHQVSTLVSAGILTKAESDLLNAKAEMLLVTLSLG